MRFVKSKKKSVAIQIIPLMDILTILLIFFVVTTTWKKNHSKLNINLPKSQKNNKSTKQEIVKKTVSLSKNGDIFLDSKKLSANELINELKAMKNNNNDDKLKIQVEADKDASFQMFIDLWIKLKNAEIKGFHIKYQNTNSQ